MRALLAASGVVLAVAAPLVTGPPSYAGIACGGGVPVPGDDCTAPSTVLTSGPDAETSSRVAGFSFGVSSPEPLGVDFACRLEGPSQAHDWRDCTDAAPFGHVPQTGSASYEDLALGSYTFSVRATDRFPLGPNTEDTPVQVTWQVVASDPDPDPDPGSPETTITTAPSRWLLDPFTEVVYEADEPLAGAECLLDGTEKKCNQRSAVIIGMAERDHTFTVAGIDRQGDVDPTPATATWTLPSDATKLRLSSEWRTKQGRGHYQDAYATTKRKGATASRASSAFRSAVLVATRCPGCGKVAISFKGTTLRKVDLDAASTRKRRLFPLGSWAEAQRGAVTVTVLSKGKPVVVEGIGLSARP
jgi:hypothetical protein